MSYEGHYIGLCEKGHKCCFPVLYDGTGEDKMFEDFRCKSPIENKPCGASLGWLVSVDDTNCDSYGIHEYIQMTPATHEMCNLGHNHTITEATFRFCPIEKYWDGENGEYVPLGSRPVKKYKK